MIVRPAPSSTPVTVPPRLSAKALDAAVRAASDAPPRMVVPDAVMGPDGAVALPTPMFPPADPETVEAVALVTPALANTPYVEAVPMLKGVSAALAVPGKKPANKAAVKPITAKILNLENFVWVLLIIFFVSKYESRCTPWCCNSENTPKSCEYAVFKEEVSFNEVFKLQKYAFAKKGTKNHEKLIPFTLNSPKLKVSNSTFYTEREV